MNKAEQQYLDILSEILETGEWKSPARAGMPRTKEVFFRTMTFDLSDGYPLFTTKKMAWKTCLTELTWFLKGDTNIKYLVDNGCNIWNDDAYKFYCRNQDNPQPKDAWLEKVKRGEIWLEEKKLGDLTLSKAIPYGWAGYIYGHQWRKFGCEGFDQIQHLINDIKNNPNGRYKIITAWNPEDFLGKYSYTVSLPACHVYYQFCVNNGKLDMMMVQRSCDMFLGVPFNIASGAALLTIIAQHTGYEPGKLHWVGNCCHIYENHMEQVKELITRTPYQFPTLIVNKQDNIEDYTKDDFTLVDYISHSKLTAPLSVGV